MNDERYAARVQVYGINDQWLRSVSGSEAARLLEEGASVRARNGKIREITVTARQCRPVPPPSPAQVTVCCGGGMQGFTTYPMPNQSSFGPKYPALARMGRGK